MSEQDCYAHAIQILQKNSTPFGFSASTEKYVNYHSIWARDHSVCVLGALATDDEQLIRTAKNGILFLLQKQIDHGQVPSYIELENKKKVYGGLGAITSIDSNMWVVIAAALLYKRTKDKRFVNKTNMQRYEKLYRLFKAFDSNDCGLIEVHRAGDWADVFDRTYHVLYDECLYYHALRALHYLFSQKQTPQHIKRANWTKRRATRVKRKINETMWITQTNKEKIRDEYMIYNKISKTFPFYVSHLEPFKLDWLHHFDTLGNCLTILTGIASPVRRENIISYTLTNNVNKPFPLTALYPPVMPQDKGWQGIYELKERPFTYHNGGIWPMITGFWIASLIKAGKKLTAKSELKQFAKLLAKDKYIFFEYNHGQTAKPMGRTEQAWSAAGYIIAYACVHNKYQPLHL
ncbi:MAG: glycogen debranching enzyme [Candidatus Woesearchaeota archaeon]|jgi:glycogen debranching enzyme